MDHIIAICDIHALTNGAVVVSLQSLDKGCTTGSGLYEQIRPPGVCITKSHNNLPKQS